MGHPKGPVGDGTTYSGGDDYRTPLLPGNYPPLGYSARGVPRYTPADLSSTNPVHDARVPAGAGTPFNSTPASSAPVPVASAQGTPPPEAASGAGTEASPRRRGLRGIEPGVGVTVGAFIVIGVVVVGLLVAAVRVLSPDPDPQVSLPPATISDYEPAPTLTLPVEPDTGIPDEDDPDTQDPDTQDPGTQIPDSDGVPTGEQVTYRVTIEGSGTILYVDDKGVRTEFSPPSRWSTQFTAGSNPLRLLVVVGEGSSGQCTILVAGRIVATDEVQPQSTRRTATCVG